MSMFTTSVFTVFILLAVLATVVSLVSGISSMAVDHQIGHRSSVQWMNLRVTFQAAALVLIILAMLTPRLA